jgi:CRP/FNR family transcriptional regulator, cyclic AMP receptor protein
MSLLRLSSPKISLLALTDTANAQNIAQQCAENATRLFERLQHVDLSIISSMAILSPQEIKDALQLSGLIDKLPASEVDALAALCGVLVLEPGEILIDEGTESEQLFIIVSGSIEVQFFLSYEDSFQEICRLRAGAILGEMAMLEDDVHSARTIAREDTRLLVLSNRELLAHLDANPRVGYQFMFNMGRMLSKRLRFTNLAIRHQLTK